VSAGPIEPGPGAPPSGAGPDVAAPSAADGDATIAAIATAAGPAGVGIVRLSGPRALTIAEAVAGRGLPVRRLVRATARDAAGTRIDDILAVAMPGPASFTGEDCAELHGHGGVVNLGHLLRAVLAHGARLAAPGEFTRRAVAHGRMDLVQAEALAEVIAAGGERAWRLAQRQLGGALGDAVRALRARAVEALAEVEASIDFPEEASDARLGAWLRAELGGVGAECRRLADTFAAGRLVQAGLVVALVGPVNAGKSSLLNALLGEERVLVDPAPGTTRDVVEASTSWDGVAVTLVDTAGLRGDPGAIEARGIALGRRRAAVADVVLAVADDAPGHDDPVLRDLRATHPLVLEVHSKVDLAPPPSGSSAIATSAHTGAGLDLLRAEILRRAGLAALDEGGGLVVGSERQRAALLDAAAGCARAEHLLAGAAPFELVAVEARAATQHLTELLGEQLTELVLDQVFARFCIGK
jgi:tRNA modification GTPase